MEITTIGLDLAKSVFQVHAVDAEGKVIVRKALRRAQVLPFFKTAPPCLVGIEACGTSHHWARELRRLGHEVRLMPPAYVKPYVKRGKTDANDAEAICEAVTRPTMRFVAIKSEQQQAALALHRTRDLLVKQRTQLVNMIRGLLAEFGIEMARGLHHALDLAARVAQGAAPDVPELAARVITGLAGQIGDLQVRLTALEKELLTWHRTNELSQRLSTIPGVGLISATALAASVTDASRFRSGRQFAASLGLTPLQNSSGGKERMGRISRMGDRYLRRLLVVGMTSLVRRARTRPDSVDPRIAAMLARKPARVVTVAAANRTARVAWSIMARGGVYRAPQGVTA
ncbi:transposase, IS1111A/IS1328/IS1533 (plasmid) [Phenylobacterium zucineum HLK1]|uniref:Transposase, IS1111A/IS1328/IS1533 n=1 Tax=Phenylobacterium zucineum (strain HLK1) TaxID=450851 RepID=B4R8I0_PHEZH|nr:IS110 family transposase [Phenylobacterium zucineum]ACG77607.1 transposase, IS1111A\IS1328\IS1533 [Phenylobacterium zucineum HLK1]ACG78052.1 transposase, IS1111A\IS1328\IS1533 [Phenylobacterium zucineum HLK1]ACG80121.1 transposase, IS1111A/IS1328/IS1533 [Phenylobacterium zucineum HLK1]ACG80262.1 transposase, IS1111A/IS1328/IS1533 [Phenylobacterium zucineum HLK1]